MLQCASNNSLEAKELPIFHLYEFGALIKISIYFDCVRMNDCKGKQITKSEYGHFL